MEGSRCQFYALSKLGSHDDSMTASACQALVTTPECKLPNLLCSHLLGPIEGTATATASSRFCSLIHNLRYGTSRTYLDDGERETNKSSGPQVPRNKSSGMILLALEIKQNSAASDGS
ncbi:hypothetical protein OPV22_013662 [Ensete ventricosum]|uniref:Uncharacterized protein n=1 Tax=Ensete ventricosum TaxID=4639 RepID=A0AAV8RA63_ENSVE|nr:hypothetical protein OPV22_013662 [Ensete ventricosum]